MEIRSPSGQTYYVSEERLGETESLRFYMCKLPGGDEGILKIAMHPAYNGELDREAYVLNEMRAKAEALEVEFAESGGKYPLNNRIFFPELIESFVSTEQEGRQISIFAFPIAKSLDEIIPLSFIKNDGVIIDPRTSAWILGKLLKMLVFTHQQGIEIGNLTDDNICINKKDHLVCLFDWSKTQFSNSELSTETASREISEVTRLIQDLLGANEHGELPEDEQLVDDSYQNLLNSFASQEEPNALSAHTKFYELIRSIWPREYYPFTTRKVFIS